MSTVDAVGSPDGLVRDPRGRALRDLRTLQGEQLDIDLAAVIGGVSDAAGSRALWRLRPWSDLPVWCSSPPRYR